MGRRAGSRSSPGLGTGLLRSRIESSKLWYGNLDEVVDCLRSTYPDYRRIKQQPFIKHVQQTLERFHQSHNLSKPTSSQIPVINDGTPDFQTPSRKRQKKTDETEERLLRFEAHHLRRKQDDQDLKLTSMSSSTSCSSEEDADSDETGGVSTSEDAVYEEKVEPKFDLTKSILRSVYASKSMNSQLEEKNVEVEAGEKVPTKINMIEANRVSRVEFSAAEKIEGKGKDGPRFKDIGGMRSVLKDLLNKVILPFRHPEPLRWLGVSPILGILLHGPPGCGKTTLAHAIANETGVPFYKISAPELVSGVSGASEENIRDLFLKARRSAPSILFIDEIDAIASKRENAQKEMERRIVTQLMTCMDESQHLVEKTDLSSDSEGFDSKTGYVLVIGATNRPDAVDPALRRPGRFDREFYLNVPDEDSRFEILSKQTCHLRLGGAFDIAKIARSTPGFVGADLKALSREAASVAWERILDKKKSALCISEENLKELLEHPFSAEEIKDISITMADFEEAIKMVQPSLRREGFSTIPDVRWEDVGGLDLLRQEFDCYVIRRIKYPEHYEEFGVDLETGFLLYGPPGCGKTLIAKAVANESGANFIHVKGPELLNKYVGESELAIRTIFSRARTCSPCVLFLDEVDALTTTRGKEGGWVVERLLNQLLVELDGADQRRGVFVIGATNRPEVMDSALLRPGRFGRLLYVPLPKPEERGLILKALARKKPIDVSVDLDDIGCSKACDNFSGADLHALVNEAAMAASMERQNLLSATNNQDTTLRTIKLSHFELALGKITPSVSEKQKEYYQKLSQRLKAA